MAESEVKPHPQHFRKIDSGVSFLRNPDVTNAYSAFVFSTLRDYARDLFTQTSPPPVVTEFKSDHGIFLPIGSLNLGGMRPETSDIDIQKVFFAPTTNYAYTTLISGENIAHPSHSFVKYLELRMQDEHPDWYEARVTGNKKSGESVSDEDLSLINFDRSQFGVPGFAEKQVGDDFILVHQTPELMCNLATTADTLSLMATMNESTWERIFHHKKNARLGSYSDFPSFERTIQHIPILLTSTPDTVIDSTGDSLSFLQREFVRAYTELFEKNPSLFALVERALQDDYALMIKGQKMSTTPPDPRYVQQIEDHVLEHGGQRATQNPSKAVNYLLSLRNNLSQSFPSIEELQRKFLS